jgi:hypothetical protein
LEFVVSNLRFRADVARLVPAACRVSAMALLAFGVVGCAQSSQSYEPSYVRALPAASVLPPPIVAVVIEDDGLPSQPPPLRRNKKEADDPREPFSPNYGSLPPQSHLPPAPVS